MRTKNYRSHNIVLAVSNTMVKNNFSKTFKRCNGVLADGILRMFDKIKIRSASQLPG